MKKFSILFLLTFITLLSNAQSVNIENNRKVLTKGYAEKEVTPDIVYLSVSLKEFYKDGNQKKKILQSKISTATINKIRKRITSYCNHVSTE